MTDKIRPGFLAIIKPFGPARIRPCPVDTSTLYLYTDTIKVYVHPFCRSSGLELAGGGAAGGEAGVRGPDHVGALAGARWRPPRAARRARLRVRLLALCIAHCECCSCYSLLVLLLVHMLLRQRLALQRARARPHGAHRDPLRPSAIRFARSLLVVYLVQYYSYSTQTTACI